MILHLLASRKAANTVANRTHDPKTLRGWAAALVWATGALLVGCGPIGYTVVQLDATEVVEEARHAGAATTAPYEYYYAQAFLNKAREEAGEAEYQNSIEMSDTARTYGQRARDLARRRGRESGR
jgi:hypothetical protein